MKMVAYVLIVLFGFAQSQSSYAVSGIATKEECLRLAAEVKPFAADASCHAYKMAKPP